MKSVAIIGCARAGEPGARDVVVLKELLRRDPRDVAAAVRLAKLYVDAGRRDSDPRPFGRAQAVLSSWWKEADPPVPVLLLRATILQFRHEFAPARADLERALEREPRNAQAWLTLATLQQVTGDLDAARASCARLTQLVPALIHDACAWSVEGATGQAGAAVDALDETLRAAPNAPPALRAWALSLQAELAERAARPAVAEERYRAALALAPGDAYSVAAYADFLLDHGRSAEVLRMIDPETQVDTLLLRYALAARAAGAPGAPVAASRLSQRFAASRARGDRTHLREEARFVLEAGGDARGALALALENWNAQREPADARIALEAAAAAKDPAAVRAIVEWVRATRLEGPALAGLVAKLERA